MDCGLDTATDSNPSSLASTPASESIPNGADSDGTTLSYSDADIRADDDADGNLRSLSPLMASKLDMMRKEPRAKMSMSPNKPGAQSPGGSGNPKSSRKNIANNSFHRTNSPRDNEDLGKAVCLKNASQLIEGLLPPVDGTSDTVEESSTSWSTQNGKENSVPGAGATAEEPEGKKTDSTHNKEDIARFLSNARQSISPSRIEDPGPGPARVAKALPRARKSLPSSSRNSPAKMLAINDETPETTRDTGSTLTNVTLRLKEIERTLGIKAQTLSKIDAKTLDKLILEKAKPKGRSTPPPKEVNDAKMSAAPPAVTQNGPSSPAPPADTASVPDNEEAEPDIKGGKRKRRRKGGTYTLPGCKKPIKRLQKPGGLKCRLGSVISKPGRKAADVDSKHSVTQAVDVPVELEGQIYDIDNKPTVKRRKKSLSKKKLLEAKQKKAVAERQTGDTVSTIPVLGTNVPYDDPAYHDSTESEGNYSGDESLSAKFLHKPVVADSPTPMDISSSLPSEGASSTVLTKPSAAPTSAAEPSSQTSVPAGEAALGVPVEPKRRKKKKRKGFARKWSQPKRRLSNPKPALTGPLPNLIRKKFGDNALSPPPVPADADVSATAATDVSSSSAADLSLNSDQISLPSEDVSIDASISETSSPVKAAATTTTISSTVLEPSDTNATADTTQVRLKEPGNPGNTCISWNLPETQISQNLAWTVSVV